MFTATPAAALNGAIRAVRARKNSRPAIGFIDTASSIICPTLCFSSFFLSLCHHCPFHPFPTYLSFLASLSVYCFFWVSICSPLSCRGLQLRLHLCHFSTRDKDRLDSRCRLSTPPTPRYASQAEESFKQCPEKWLSPGGEKAAATAAADTAAIDSGIPITCSPSPSSYELSRDTSE